VHKHKCSTCNVAQQDHTVSVAADMPAGVADSASHCLGQSPGHCHNKRSQGRYSAPDNWTGLLGRYTAAKLSEPVLSTLWLCNWFPRLLRVNAITAGPVYQYPLSRENIACCGGQMRWPLKCKALIRSLHFCSTTGNGNLLPSRQSSTIIPVPKPGKYKSDPSSYHPIALTSCIMQDYGTYGY